MSEEIRLMRALMGMGWQFVPYRDGRYVGPRVVLHVVK